MNKSNEKCTLIYLDTDTKILCDSEDPCHMVLNPTSGFSENQLPLFDKFYFPDSVVLGSSVSNCLIMILFVVNPAVQQLN